MLFRVALELNDAAAEDWVEDLVLLVLYTLYIKLSRKKYLENIYVYFNMI